MTVDLTSLLDHDPSDDCPVCRAQEFIQIALLPAAAWKLNNELPRFSVALHGAAELLGAMLLEGVERSDIEASIAEDQMMGGPSKGSA